MIFHYHNDGTVTRSGSNTKMTLQQTELLNDIMNDQGDFKVLLYDIILILDNFFENNLQNKDIEINSRLR